MDSDKVVSIHQVADEAQKKLEPFSYKAEKAIMSASDWIGVQIHRFRHPTALFVMAVILILALTTGDVNNLIPVIGLLITFGCVWTFFSFINRNADTVETKQVETVEIEEDWE